MVEAAGEQLFNNVSGLNVTEGQEVTEAEAGVAIITFYLVLVSTLCFTTIGIGKSYYRVLVLVVQALCVAAQ